MVLYGARHKRTVQASCQEGEERGREGKDRGGARTSNKHGSGTPPHTLVRRPFPHTRFEAEWAPTLHMFCPAKKKGKGREGKEGGQSRGMAHFPHLKFYGLGLRVQVTPHP